MGAVCSSKTLVATYKTAWCCNPQDHDPDTQFGFERSNGKVAHGRRACGMGILHRILAKYVMKTFTLLYVVSFCQYLHALIFM